MDTQLADPSVRGATVRAGLRHSPLGQRLVALGVLGLVTALCLLAVLPTLLWRMPEPKPIPLGSLEGQVSGTYLTMSSGGFLKLVPYADSLPRLPGQVPVAGARPEFLLRARQLDALGAYEILTWGTDRIVPVTRSRRDEHTIAVGPSRPLAAGYYYVKAARDSADRADDYFYFQVK